MTLDEFKEIQHRNLLFSLKMQIDYKLYDVDQRLSKLHAEILMALMHQTKYEINEDITKKLDEYKKLSEIYLRYKMERNKTEDESLLKELDLKLIHELNDAVSDLV